MTVQGLISGVSPDRITNDGQIINRQGLRDGTARSIDWVTAHSLEGRVFYTNGGVGTTPITFAGAYDANGPDAHIHVPDGTTIIPVSISVTYDALGTEATLEIIALASNTGDSSVTGTASTVYSSRIDAPIATNCTATFAVDAAGVTDPNAGNFFEFWRTSKPLADTVASGENDRASLDFKWDWSVSPPPTIVGGPVSGSALTVYAAAQAGTGFITISWIEVLSNTIV